MVLLGSGTLRSIILYSIALLAMAALPCCKTSPDQQPDSISTHSTSLPFSDVTEQCGVTFIHSNGMTGEFNFPEIMGAGGALLDYDRDGDLDLYLVQGQLLDYPRTMKNDETRHSEQTLLKDRLFRNDTSPTGGLSFSDVTDQTGLIATDYGMGAASGDFNNDGYPDLYIANFGKNRLLQNNGDGTFTDIADKAGVQDAGFSVSASWTDYDGDGWLDLFVANYVDFQVASNKACYGRSRDYCHPTNYEALPDRLFRNQGDGTFEDVSQSSGVNLSFGRALGVTGADFNGDNRPDFYVANDTTANQLWLNMGDGTFKEKAMLAGCALNEMGMAEASMGVDASDFDNDGDLDLFMTHNRNETNTLYINDGGGVFSDGTNAAGLGSPSLPYAGFGAAWFDYDNDGLLDLFCANGAVVSIASELPAGDPYPYHQRNQLFRNMGNNRFQDMTAQAGAPFQLSEVSRGALFGDLDNDGDTDLVITNNNGPARVFQNNGNHQNHWLGLSLVHGETGQHILGARIEVLREGKAPMWRRSKTDGSYASSNDPRVLVGLGSDGKPVDLRIHWPTGHMETWKGLESDTWHKLIMGTSKHDQEGGAP